MSDSYPLSVLCGAERHEQDDELADTKFKLEASEARIADMARQLADAQHENARLAELLRVCSIPCVAKPPQQSAQLHHPAHAK